MRQSRSSTRQQSDRLRMWATDYLMCSLQHINWWLTDACNHHKKKETSFQALTENNHVYWKHDEICSDASHNHENDFCKQLTLNADDSLLPACHHHQKLFADAAESSLLTFSINTDL